MKKTIIITLLAVAVLLNSCSHTNRKGRKGKGFRPSPAVIMQRLDANKDGGITYDEFNLPSKRGVKAPAGVSVEEMRQKRFAKIDSNSDQVITRAELANAQSPKRVHKRKEAQ